MFKLGPFCRLAMLGLLLQDSGSGAVAQSACAFTAPEGWNPLQTRWDGACRAGYAEGLGVMKEVAADDTQRFFFGRVKRGDLDLGVIDEDEGFMAGRFRQGSLIDSDDRHRAIRAYAEAQKAAQQAASRFRKTGNRASARFYEIKAKQLRDQLD